MSELYINNDLKCCGLTEISGLSSYDPEEVIKQMLEADPTLCHNGVTLFTGAGSTKGKVKYAEEFAKYVTKHGLGKVERHKPVINRNTTHYITLYVWFTDKKGLKKWELNVLPNLLKAREEQEEEEGYW